jgi:uncharacterized protein YggE
MKSLIVALALFAAGPVVSAHGQDVAARTADSQPVIVTEGEAVIRRAPDLAWVTIAVESRARTADEAQRANISSMNAVIAKVKESGVAAEAIQTVGYELQPEFDYADGRQTLRGYLARNQLRVRVDALERLGAIIGAAVATGATNVNSVSFDLKDRDSVEREALSGAVADAVGRAQAMAAGAHVAAGQIVRIEEQRESQVPQPRPVAMMRESVQAAPAGPVPIEGGQIEIRARVTVTTAIK